MDTIRSPHTPGHIAAQGYDNYRLQAQALRRQAMVDGADAAAAWLSNAAGRTLAALRRRAPATLKRSGQSRVWAA